jgi:hypothetical protein
MGRKTMLTEVLRYARKTELIDHQQAGIRASFLFDDDDHSVLRVEAEELRPLRCVRATLR